MEESSVPEDDLMAYFLAWAKTGLRHEAFRLSRLTRKRRDHEVLTLDRPLLLAASSPEDCVRLIDLIDAQDNTEREAEERMMLDSVMEALTPKQREVIRGVVLQGQSERVVARTLGISQVGVNKTRRAALKRIRPYLS